MKLYKTLDVGIQLLIIVAGIPFCLLAEGESFFYPYFILGGWQVLSCFIHWFLVEYYYPVKARRYYVITLFVVFALGMLSIAGFLLSFLYLLLFLSPFMGLWYCYICYKEVTLYHRKEWVQLR
jgi:hypothetical protein